MNYTPLKWTGSKRAFADYIIEKINPDSIRHYIEPFAGGANIGLKLIERMGSRIETYTFSDTNEDLINIWELILSNPSSLYRDYERRWNRINFIDSVDRRKDHYYHERNMFNMSKNSNRIPKHIQAQQFYFLLRTCYNGMVRYNSKGEFNSPYHFSRKGMHPDKVGKILLHWAKLMQNVDVEFIHQDYRGIFNKEHKEGTFIFLDPPYINIKKNTIYDGNIEHDVLFDMLLKLPEHISWAMTIDGDCDLSVFGDTIVTHNLNSNSSFKRMKGAGSGNTTTEKLVLNVA